MTCGGGKILYFDCFSGVCAKRMIGAMLDLGIDPLFFQTEMNKLCAFRAEFLVTRIKKNGVEGFEVKTIVSDDKILCEDEISSIMLKSGFCLRIKKGVSNCAALLRKRLTKIELAEAAGVFSLIDLIKPDFVLASAVTISTHSEHISSMLKNACIPTKEVCANSKIVTKTGAAILSSCAQFQYIGRFDVLATGYGIGTQEWEVPNLLKVVLGQRTQEVDGMEIGNSIEIQSREGAVYSMEKKR